MTHPWRQVFCAEPLLHPIPGEGCSSLARRGPAQLGQEGSHSVPPLPNLSPFGILLPLPPPLQNNS